MPEYDIPTASEKPTTETKQVKKCLCNPEIGRHPKCPSHG